MKTDLGAAADELYGLPAREFTAARDRLAADARQSGDRELAAAIKKLRRPTATAWLANQLVRQCGHQVAELLDTGAALRRAQADLDVAELRRQTQEGQRLVTELAGRARQLAGDAGESLTDGMIRDLEETLHAGLVDPAASDAIRAGHLTTALRYSGFGLLDLEGPAAAAPAALAKEVPAAPTLSLVPEPSVRPSPEPANETRRQMAGPDPATGQQEARAQQAERAQQTEQARLAEQARQARQAAEAELAVARHEAGEAARRVEQARQRQDGLRQQIRALDEELEQLRAEEAEASDAVAVAARDRRAADDRLAQAEESLDRVASPPSPPSPPSPR